MIGWTGPLFYLAGLDKQRYQRKKETSMNDAIKPDPHSDITNALDTLLDAQKSWPNAAQTQPERPDLFDAIPEPGQPAPDLSLTVTGRPEILQDLNEDVLTLAEYQPMEQTMDFECDCGECMECVIGELCDAAFADQSELPDFDEEEFEDDGEDWEELGGEA